MDEAHERDMNSDFLLTVLKNMLETYVLHDLQCFMLLCGNDVFIFSIHCRGPASLCAADPT